MMNRPDSTAASGPLFQPGESFRGYAVECLLGRGGLGSVWLARHQMLDTLFAIKTLDPILAREKPEYVRRFVREAKLATKIRHPNLVAVHDAGYDADKGVYFLVMDYVKGDTLRNVVAIGGPQPEKEAVGIILRVADVLAKAQRYGMVHRDLKPENIMIANDGTVKLLDLGVAKTSGGVDSLKTMANSVFGTPAYISPEQAVDSSTVDPRADVYSLGVVLFELLCGRRPYNGSNPADIMKQLLDPSPVPDVRTLKADISPPVAEVLQRMCAKRIEDRIASPQGVIDEFACIGYVEKAEPSSEFAAVGSADGSVKEILDGIGNGAAFRTLDLDTQDPEMRAFIAKLRRRRVLRIGAAALVACLVAAMVVYFVGRWGRACF